MKSSSLFLSESFHLSWISCNRSLFFVISSVSVFFPESEIAVLSSPGVLREKPAEIPRASSPTPIKVDQILHKELLAETGLSIEGQVRFVPFDTISALATGL